MSIPYSATLHFGTTEAFVCDAWPRLERTPDHRKFVFLYRNNPLEVWFIPDLMVYSFPDYSPAIDKFVGNICKEVTDDLKSLENMIQHLKDLAAKGHTQGVLEFDKLVDGKFHVFDFSENGRILDLLGKLNCRSSPGPMDNLIGASEKVVMDHRGYSFVVGTTLYDAVQESLQIYSKFIPQEKNM
ncbi:MAG: hypothetical protein V1837_06440 [Candidatus Woesearchaeota archaeon]